MQAPSPGRSPIQAAADIINIIEARAGAVTLTNTLFLAGVGPQMDWIADLGSTGKRVGRFALEQYTSNAFNKSGAWLGNPQAVSPLHRLASSDAWREIFWLSGQCRQAPGLVQHQCIQPRAAPGWANCRR